MKLLLGFSNGREANNKEQSTDLVFAPLVRSRTDQKRALGAARAIGGRG
jgi:hypothetical protein